MIEIPMIVWNMIITLVFVPILNSIRVNTQELKRLEILVNKTREEIAKEYVTKNELKDDMSILMDRIDKIGEKLDKLFAVKYHRSIGLIMANKRKNRKRGSIKRKDYTKGGRVGYREGRPVVDRETGEVFEVVSDRDRFQGNVPFVDGGGKPFIPGVTNPTPVVP